MACLALGAEGIFSQYVKHLQTSQHAQCNGKFLFNLCEIIHIKFSYLFRESLILVNWGSNHYRNVLILHRPLKSAQKRDMLHWTVNTSLEG